jgi:hypothetical protein
MVTLSDPTGASVTWIGPQPGALSVNQPTALEFVVDAQLADCKAWETTWQQRLAAPGSPEKDAGLRVLDSASSRGARRAPWLDERWSNTIVANPQSGVLVSNYRLARWELCLPQPKGGVVLARTAGGERNVALMLHGPSAEIATALYGKSARHSMAVDSVPVPASQAQAEQTCAALGEPKTVDELLSRPAACSTLDSARAETLACQYGYWLSCALQGEEARDEGDLATAAALLQRSCDITQFADICKRAQEARQQLKAAKKP